MPVPKRKRSRARRDSRFANKGLKVKSFGECPNCQAARLPHVACRECGFYKGAKAIATKNERTIKRGEVRKAAVEARGKSNGAESSEKPE
jgi:large subunit ribosomal protein L32